MRSGGTEMHSPYRAAKAQIADANVERALRTDEARTKLQMSNGGPLLGKYPKPR